MPETTPHIPEGLPRLAQDYTAEQRQACVDYLASLDLKELRSRQAIKDAEIDEAYRRVEQLGDDILTSVQEHRDQIDDAIHQRCFPSMHQPPTS